MYVKSKGTEMSYGDCSFRLLRIISGTAKQVKCIDLSQLRMDDESKGYRRWARTALSTGLVALIKRHLTL